MPEFDREGRAVCQFWLQAANTIRLSQTRELKRTQESPWGPLDSQTPFKGRKEGSTRFPKKLTALKNI